ncbi:TPA: LytR/AlgR family response regulator transcription factor [Enterococcus faecalis]
MEEVFQVQTFDYLLKPPTEDRLHQVLEKLRQQLEKKRNYFVFSSNKVTYKIPTKDIIYFEKDKRQVLIHTVGEIYKPYMSTNQINEQLDTNFVQVHSSFIINYAYIKELGKNFLLMDSKEKCIEIPISRRFKAAAHKSIVMSMRGKI